MTDRLKVNFIFTYPNMAGGTKSCRLLAEEMQRQGADVVIYHPDDPRYGYTPSFKQSIKDLIRYIKKLKRKPGDMKHHLEVCEVPVVACKGHTILEHQVRNADFNIGNFWLQRAWMFDWSREKGIPGLYVRGHAVGGFSSAERLQEAYQAPGVTITHATWLKKLLEDEYQAEHVILAPNGIDREQFFYTPRKKQSVPTIGFQYAHSERKGAKTMFAAFDLLLAENPSLQLVSFGSDDVAEYDRQRKNWRHECRPSYQRITEIYHECDCWVLPSLSEGLPMPPLEASACGTPVVATLCGGPEDYVSEGASGYLVPLEDPFAMAEAIKKIIYADDSRWESMSIKSYENSLPFDWKVSAAHLISELKKYLKTHRPH